MLPKYVEKEPEVEISLDLSTPQQRKFGDSDERILAKAVQISAVALS